MYTPLKVLITRTHGPVTHMSCKRLSVIHQRPVTQTPTPGLSLGLATVDLRFSVNASRPRDR